MKKYLRQPPDAEPPIAPPPVNRRPLFWASGEEANTIIKLVSSRMARDMFARFQATCKSVAERGGGGRLGTNEGGRGEGGAGIESLGGAGVWRGLGIVVSDSLRLRIRVAVGVWVC